MRILFIMLILGSLAACASNAIAEYKPEHWQGNPWIISGKTEGDEDEDFITIMINSIDVMSGDLSKEKPEENLIGNFEEYDLSAKCKFFPDGGENERHTCTVSVNDEVAGKITF